MGYDYFDLYEMTIIELENTLKYKKQGLAYQMWRNGYMNAISIASCFSKNAKFPRTPEDAFPELYPPKPTLKASNIPKEILQKYHNRRGVRK